MHGKTLARARESETIVCRRASGAFLHGEADMQAVIRLPSSETEKPSDHVLIASIATGDKHAMVLLFMRHNVRIHRFVARLTGNASLADDVVSDVFLDVWRGATDFRGRSSVSTWLLGIARHKAMTALRRQKEAALDQGVAAAIADDGDDPEAAAHQASRGAVIRRCLMRLPPALREVIDLIYYHEMSVTEVAEIVGIPPGTVKTRMFHARTRLHEMLQGAGVHCVLAD
jgi:RNA polymerase sigma-70 factor, ECF subfamily